MVIPANFNYFTILILSMFFCLTGMHKDALERGLLNAVKMSMFKNVETYLKLGISPEITNADGESLIEIAIDVGELRSLKLLLDYGADPNKTNSTGDDYLSQIIKTPNSNNHYYAGPSCMSLLLGYGANPNGADNMSTPLNSLITLRRTDLVSQEKFYLLTRDHIDHNLRDYRGNTPFYNALMSDQKDIAQLLLTYGTVLNDSLADFEDIIIVTTEPNYKTLFMEKLYNLFEPITLSCLLGDVQRLKELWKRSAINKISIVGNTLRRIKKRLPKTRSKKRAMTLLHWAASQGHQDMVQFLLKNHVNKSRHNMVGDTPADLAARNGHLECARIIREAGGKFNRTGWLLSSVYRRDLKAVKKLIVENPTLINEHDNNGNRPLHIAGVQPYTPMLNALLCDGADLYIRNNGNISAVQAIFTNCCPGDLLQVSTLLLEPVLKVLAKSETAGVALVGSIPEMRLYLANHLACSHLQLHNNSKIAKERSLSVIKTLNALQSTAKKS
jgi:ankyrin repeat protein